MAAGLLDYDWMMSVKEKPWHGIGTVVEEAPTSEDAIRLAKLDWNVEQFPVYANGNSVDGYFANVRSDTNEALGIVKGRYKIVQNVEAFDFVDGIISNNSDIECRYETAGSLFNGKRIFLLVRLPNNKILGDEIENYLFFTNSHDGTSSLISGISNIRVVCNNTLQLALQEAKRVWKCRHTTNIETKKHQAIESLGFAINYTDKMKYEAEKLASIKISKDKFIASFSEELDKLNYTEKGKNETINRIITIYDEKDDLQNFKGTGWGIYNATADFISNTAPFRKTSTFEEKRLEKFFDGNIILDTVQKLLVA